MIRRRLEQPPVDVPQTILGNLSRKVAHAKIVCVESGIIAGIEALERRAKTLGLHVTPYVSSGSRVVSGSIVALVAGNPVQIVVGEDWLLGTVAKVSGVASAANAARSRAGRLRVVCGGWKKMPASMKDELRDALKAGGLDARIASGPFLYLDKNYVRLLGSIVAAMESAAKLPGRTIVIQLRGETAPISEEAIIAARRGAHILMVDTGRLDDLRSVSAALRHEGLRREVEIAFAGNLTLGDLEWLQHEDTDVVDIGRAILDAPLLDFRYDVFDIRVCENGFSPS